MTEHDLHQVLGKIAAVQEDVRKICIALERLSATAEFSAKSLAETRDQLNAIDETQADLRVAVGKLEVKNGVIAAILGGITGLFSSRFGG